MIDFHIRSAQLETDHIYAVNLHLMGVSSMIAHLIIIIILIFNLIVFKLNNNDN